MTTTSRRRGRQLQAAGAAALVLTAAGCAGGTAASESGTVEEVKIVVAETTTPNSPGSLALKDYAAAVEEASDGNITFEFHFSGSLLPAAEIVEGLGSGIADMAIILPAYSPSQMPIGNWVSRLGSQRNANFPIGALQAGGAHAETMLASDEVQAEFANLNAKLLAPIYSMQQFDLLCKEPVTDLESAKNKTVRVAGETWAEDTKSIGMVPVTIMPEEVYESFQRGVIDCVSMAPQGYYEWGFTDVGKEYSPVNFSGFNSTYFVSNADFWDTLSPATQEVLWQQLPDFLAGYQNHSIASHRSFAETEGLSINDLDPEVNEVVHAHQRSVVDNMAADAPSGVAEPQAFLDDYQSALADWESVVVDELGYEEMGSSGDAWRQAYTSEWDLTAWRDALAQNVFASVPTED